MVLVGSTLGAGVDNLRKAAVGGNLRKVEAGIRSAGPDHPTRGCCSLAVGSLLEACTLLVADIHFVVDIRPAVNRYLDLKKEEDIGFAAGRQTGCIVDIVVDIVGSAQGVAFAAQDDAFHQSQCKLEVEVREGPIVICRYLYLHNSNCVKQKS